MTDLTIQCIEIATQSDKYKKEAFFNITLLSHFLNGFKLSSVKDETINNWLAKQLIEEEFTDRDADKTIYTYWVGGSLSWAHFSHFIPTLKTEEEEISTSITNYDIHYIYTDLEKMKVKTLKLYSIIKELQDKLQRNNITSHIDTTNFNYTSLSTIDDTNTNEKKISFNIKLVLDDIRIELEPIIEEGGSKPPRPNKARLSQGKYVVARLFANTYRPLLYAETIKQNKEILKNKLIVEVTLDYYNTYPKQKPKIFDIKKFEEQYLLKPEDKYKNTDDYLTIVGKLHKLNPLGLLTFSHLTNTDKKQTMGLNIDLYRQDYFISKYLKNDKKKIKKMYSRVIGNYINVYKTITIFNMFFTEKIEKIIKKRTIRLYDDFIDYIERWLMLLFRPAINSFIIEINKDLVKYGIKLFIAGGDAMRRFNFNISSTKDIDVKLYIKNIKDLALDAKDRAKPYDELRNEIITIIANQMVKLRNYLEENYVKLFDIITMEYNSKTQKVEQNVKNYSSPIVFTTNNNKEKYEIMLISPYNKNKQYFRTREVKKSDKFPVDLYSIDYQTFIKQTKEYVDKDTKEIKITTRELQLDIALLDIVLQDEEYKEEFVDESSGIPVASVMFLQHDLELTYTTQEKAIGRITTGKYNKDIDRYKTLCSPNRTEIIDNTIPKEHYDKIVSDIQTKTPIDNTIKSYFLIILYKLQNPTIKLSFIDIIICIRLYNYLYILDNLKQTIPEDTIDKIKKLITNITFFKVNIYNEKLKETISNYETADNDKNNNYLKLFKYLIFEDVNNEEKHSIPFSNRSIENLIKKLLISSRVPVKQVPATKATASKTQKSVPVQRAPKTIGSKKPIPVVVPVAKSAPVPTHGRSTRAQTKAQTQAKK